LNVQERDSEDGAGRLLAFFLGIAWIAAHEYIEKRTDPPGWIIDRPVYQPAVALSWVGLVVFLITSLLCIAQYVFRRLVHRKHS
jgi:hypothetical protein